MTNRTLRLVAAAAVGLPVLASYAVRGLGLGDPIVDEFSFRQTQTAITVRTFVDEGIDLLHYQTPVFGPPWEVPFEFPIFQATAALLARSADDVERACRLANLLYFTLAAPFLFLLTRQFVRRPAVAVCVTAAYLCHPYNVFWSRTAMIDYCSVFFALGYLYFFARHLTGRGGWGALLLAVLFGTLGALTKVTTMPVAAVPVLWLAGRRLAEHARAAGRPWSGPAARTALALAAGALIPLAAAQLWVAHTDRVKAATPAAAPMTSGRLTAWVYGPLSQRATPATWGRIAWRLDYPYLMAAGLLWAAARLRRPERGFVLSMILGAVLTVAVFFNLHYIHSYYQMACTPAVAVASGLGLYVVAFRIVRRPALQWGLLGVLLVPMVARGHYTLTHPTKVQYDPAAVGAYLRSVTEPGEWVVIEGADWNPDVLFHARRKGLMWVPRFYTDAERAAVLEGLGRGNYTTLLSRDGPPTLLDRWKRHREVGTVEGFRVYKVGDE